MDLGIRCNEMNHTHIVYQHYNYECCLIIGCQCIDFSNRAIGIINFEKTFSKFYHRHYELISKYNVGLKTLLSEGLSEPEFYGDLVYKFKKLIGSNVFLFFSSEKS